MPAVKIYVVGGLVLLLVLLFHLWWGSWPWEGTRTVQYVLAAIIFDPIGIALGAVALALGPLQPHVQWSNQFKITMGVAYLVGAGMFWGGIYAQSLEGGGFPLEFTFVVRTGVALVLVAVVVNLVGVLKPSLGAKAGGKL